MSIQRLDIVETILPILHAVRLYHRHEVVGIEAIPTQGPALIVANHSLATYDIILLMAAIYSEFGRLARPLADRLFFKVPLVSEIVDFLGAVAGSPANAERLLAEGELVTVAPGGMREALRPSTERYQVRWQKRKGFARLAMQAGSPVVLAACPKADDLYDVYSNAITSWFYRKYKVPVFLARGLGPTPLPRPTKLVHFLSEPIQPPPCPTDPEQLELKVAEFHLLLIRRMHRLISEAIQNVR